MKLPALTGPAAAAQGEIRQLTSDLFHELSQPLTNLCCSLELALLESPTMEEYRGLVSQARLQAEKASELATSIRELLDASYPGEKTDVFDLSRIVDNAVDDFLPVAQSAGVELAYLPQPSCPVCFDAHRLRQGLFHLLGSLIVIGGQGSVLKIEVEAQGQHTVLRLKLSVVVDRNGTLEPQAGRELQQRLAFAISRSIFEAAGGTFSVEWGSQSLFIAVHVPARAT